MVAFYLLDHFHSINGHFQKVILELSLHITQLKVVQINLINKPGYNLYPRSNFVITKVILGNIHWEKGFVKTESGDFEIE